MKNVLTIILLLLSLTSFASAATLSSFETDYCTNYPEGTKEKPELWKHCCLLHDMFFWAGGSKDERNIADLDLKTCIEETGQTRQAALMYYAVRAGSYSPIKYPKRRWGNGWEGRKAHEPLNSQEVSQIEQDINANYDFITPALKKYFLQKLHSRLDQ